MTRLFKMHSRIFNICRASSWQLPNTLEISRGLCQNVNTTENVKVKKPAVFSQKFPGYQLVYKFKFIRFASLINGLKHKQGTVSLACVPLGAVLSLAGVIPLQTLFECTLFLIGANVWIYSFGYSLQNFVAYIYLKKDEEKVVISYVDSSGKRKDVHTTVLDVQCSSGIPCGFMDLLCQKMELMSCDQSLKFSLLCGNLVDEKQFEFLLGKSRFKKK